jgi:hypothetical protein
VKEEDRRTLSFIVMGYLLAKDSFHIFLEQRFTHFVTDYQGSDSYSYAEKRAFEHAGQPDEMQIHELLDRDARHQIFQFRIAPMPRLAPVTRAPLFERGMVFS